LDRVTYLSDLYRQSASTLTKDKREWMGLLSGMARFYQMSFDKNVLVYAQRPGAELIATMKGWREATGRSIKRGAKAIAVTNMNQPKASLTYYFDFADTYGDYESLRKAMSLDWDLEEQYQPELRIRFQEKYGLQTQTVEECLMKIVQKQAEQVLPVYLENFQIHDPSNMLYSLPVDAVKEEFGRIMLDSAIYVILKKCGLSTEVYEGGNFGNISHFNDLELFMAMGYYTLSIARPVLRAVHEQIELIKQERSKAHEREDNKNQAIDSTRLQEGRGRDDVSELTDIPPRVAERSEELRTDVENVHDGKSSEPPVRTDSGGKDQSDTDNRRRGGRGTEGATDKGTAESPANAGDRGFNGESQSYEHDNLHSRGNPNQRGNINDKIKKNEVDEYFEIQPSVDDEKSFTDGFSTSPKETSVSINKATEEESVIDEMINKFLCDEGVISGKPISPYDVQQFLSSAYRQEEKEDLVKLTYEMLELEYQVEDDAFIQVRGQEDGLVFSYEEESRFYSYQELTAMIEKLILAGIYPFSNEEQLDEYAIPDELEEMQVEQRIEYSYEQYSLAEQFELYESYPSREEFQEDPVGISKSDRINYRFSPDHHLYEGGAKTKCRNNIAAINLLKELADQDRMANTEEQVILANYVGWGGLANALTPDKSGWKDDYAQIKSLLTEDEFQSAQESTTTAYYTDQEIIRCIYLALERFGFQGGNILDPAMGNGNFYSMLPEGMSESKLYGVELDTVSGQIAKQLYQKADIEIRGYEHTQYPDQFFDVAIGNIPFNSLSINDSRYNKHNFKIHDYFIAKTLDKVRAGGIIAFITTKGTLDKGNSSVRKYMAQRAELIGAARLPNTAFQTLAGTKATADILFLQKREREITPTLDNSPWISVEENDEGIPVNRYFLDHPEMLLGKMVFDESMYANSSTTACVPVADESFMERLNMVIHYLDASYQEPSSEFEDEQETVADSIAADPKVKNFSYAVIDGEIYYREHSRMYHQEITGKKAARIKGMVGIHGAVRELVDFQTNEYNREHLTPAEYEVQVQERIQALNQVYDRFIAEYGYINSYANAIAFSKDIAAPLIRSIESEIEDQKDEYEKSAIFYKPTIRPQSLIIKAESAEEALRISLNKKGRVDLDFMSQIYEKPGQSNITQEEIVEELGDRIYQDPAKHMDHDLTGWVVAEEYLSGYVKDKLVEAIIMAEREPERYGRNVDALKQVQPEPLTPSEINFTLGSTWIPVEVYQEFMYETFKTNSYNKYGTGAISLEFSPYSSAYFINSKSAEKYSITATRIYGTERINAYEILETSLNLKTVEVRDRVDYVDEQGEEKIKYVLNKAETILAREKQAELKLTFENWLFVDPERSTALTNLYNDQFNNIRPRVYNGDDLLFPDVSHEIKLRKHQGDVVAHAIYGEGNLLAAHEVGAGKTISAIVASYELKRINTINKPLIAVPNHLVGQWAREYMRVYPNANILVAEKKDLEKRNRRRFVSRIASGDFHAVIMAQSSFELIGLSREYQLSVMKTELDAITDAIDYEKRMSDKKWSLKQMMIFRKNLQNRYDLLFKAEKKDDVIAFEELGVDALVVDEAHVYKNNFSYTKMRGVAGVGSSSSQRAMDMHMKCQYINDLNHGKGVIYLTGTPISNSMSELYVLQKTLQPKDLETKGLLMFDCWASTFGRVESSLEIKPEGNGYQMKSRFAKFHNIPELMSMFSMVADIKTADMLDLKIPKLKTGEPQIIKTKVTPAQKAMIMEQGERAENIRAGQVDSSVDNFLKLTMEARLLSVDPRILDPSLPDDPDTKLNVCSRKVAAVYHETTDQQSSQLVFCDQGTPKADGGFNFYDAIKESLIKQAVKRSEIAFIHDARTDVQKEQLFEKVRNGEIRVLLGSTAMMGTGMNCQKKLIAVHHLDIPWRPADLIQRNGRVLRQGNDNEEVSIYNYITEQTFDSYLWQILEQKQRYISQIMTGRSALRSCDDIDDTVLQYAEFKALAISDDRIKKKMEVDNEIQRLQILKSSWKTNQNDLQHKISCDYPARIGSATKKIEKERCDSENYRKEKPAAFQMTIDRVMHTERTKAAEHFKVLSRRLGQETGASLEIGSYAGFTLSLSRPMLNEIRLCLKGFGTYYTDIGDSELGAITRMENLAERISELLEEDERLLENLQAQLEVAKQEIAKPFPSEERLNSLLKEKVELDLALEFHEDHNAAADEEGVINMEKEEGDQGHGSEKDHTGSAMEQHFAETEEPEDEREQ